MKLINRKTGQIVVYGEGIVDLKSLGCKNVAEMLEAGWEDYKEPEKHHYYIEPRGQVIELIFGHDVDELKEELNEIGNYFETREEAEKAVEKLKAWQRLKDAGFKFIGKTYETDKRFGSIFYEVDKDTYSEDIIDDLDLLFGGEDEDN